MRDSFNYMVVKNLFMDYIWFLIGFGSGLLVGSGAVLYYINRKFTASVQRFEEEMDFLENLGKEEKIE